MTAADPVTGVALRPTPADARRWIEADFDLLVRAVDQVSGGTDAAAVVWRVEDDDGGVWAAKWTTRRTVTGTQLVGSLSDAGSGHAPATLRAADGRPASRRRGGRLTMSAWSSGTDAATVGLDLAGWRAYGELLGDLHRHPFPLPERRRGARRGIRRRRRRYRAEIRALDALAAGPPAAAHTAASADQADTGRPADPASTTDTAAAALALWCDARPRVDLLLGGTDLRRTDGADRPDPARVPCHGDPHLGNVLVEPDGRLRLVDWDEAVVGHRELDLHLVEFSVLFRPTTPAELEAFRAGYGPAALDERRLVRYACVRALEDLTSSATAALTAEDEADRVEGLRVLRGVLSPVGSASLVEPRLRAALAADQRDTDS